MQHGVEHRRCAAEQEVQALAEQCLYGCRAAGDEHRFQVEAMRGKHACVAPDIKWHFAGKSIVAQPYCRQFRRTNW
jgi:hypothetical protein